MIVLTALLNSALLLAAATSRTLAIKQRLELHGEHPLTASSSSTAVPPRNNMVVEPHATETNSLRPDYVRDFLMQHQSNEDEKIIYYFGLGSNMLRSKLENRGSFGGNSTSKIEFLSMEPAYVKNYRLSFNLRGFCPLEPGMGSLEPADSPHRPIHSYEQPECHGALVALTRENYEKVMRSEGIGPNVTNPGYEEIVITAIPYDSRKKPVTAIALRARPHVRWPQDPTPSQRYMDILKEGAAELQLKPSYQSFLATYPVQQSPLWLKRLSVYNLICTMTISSLLKWRGLSKLQNFLLYCVYVPSVVAHWRRRLSNVAMGAILLPGACFGVTTHAFRTLTGRPYSPMMQRFISMLDASSSSNPTRTINVTAS
jgi:hypothetical protein